MSEETDDIPESLLFVCSYNAVRSPIAECFAKSYCGDKVFIDSVGVKNKLEKVNPFAVSVMEEAELDLSNHNPKHHSELNVTEFDVIIALSEEAYEVMKDLTRTAATQVEYWPTFDPTKVQGNRENIMSSFREVHDQLMQKITNRVPKSCLITGK